MSTRVTSFFHRGFALPTVLIASVVLLTVLAVSVTATTTARTTLKTQYYTQLAQIAGEAGAAYATACLQNNDNIPQWSNANPLRPNTNCAGVSQNGLNCSEPANVSDASCSVMVEGNIRSSFEVRLPTLGPDGRATAIPQNGIVHVLRETTQTPWRSYQQPAVQSAVVPALCSGSATSALGWSNVAVQAVTQTFPEPTARSISTSLASNTPAGQYAVRKDFNIVTAGTYEISFRADDLVKVYIDGRLISEVSSYTTSPTTVNVALEPGCHVVHADVTNYSAAPIAGLSYFMFSLKQPGATRPIVVSDSSWRQASGVAVNYGSLEYLAHPFAWAPVRILGAYNGGSWPSGPAGWLGATNNDTQAQWLATNHSFTGANYPYNQYSYYRTLERESLTFSTPTDVDVAFACDDFCVLFLNGERILSSAGNASAALATVQFPAGRNQLAVELRNVGGSAVDNPAGFILSIKRDSDNVIIERSDAQWYAASSWTAAAETYVTPEQSYRPSPDVWSCDCPNQGATNMVRNPSYETNTTDTAGVAASITRFTSGGFANPSFIRMNVSSLGFFPRVSQTVDGLEVGQVYNLSGYIRANTNASIGWQFIDNFGNAMFINGSGFGRSAAANPANNWRRFSIVTPPVPVGAASVRIWLGVADNSAVGTVFDVDAVQATAGPNLYVYYDGSSSGWTWRGTAHGSISHGRASLAP